MNIEHSLVLYLLHEQPTWYNRVPQEDPLHLSVCCVVGVWWTVGIYKVNKFIYKVYIEL